MRPEVGVDGHDLSGVAALVVTATRPTAKSLIVDLGHLFERLGVRLILLGHAVAVLAGALRPHEGEEGRSSGLCKRDGHPGQRVGQAFEVFLVERDDGGGFFLRMGDDEQVAVESRPADESCATLRGPQARCSTPGGGGRRQVSKLTRELVKTSQAPARIDPQELATQLVVRNLGDQKLVLANRATKPGTYVVVLPRMADLAQDAGIEEKSHVVGL